jgi:hypothetical protein
MVRMLRRVVWIRGLAIGLLLVAVNASPLRADIPVLEAKYYARIAYGLISAGVNPSDAMDVVVNLRFCAGISADPDAYRACMKPFLDKVGIRSISDLDFYAGVVGHFSVYESITKTAGGLDLKPDGYNQNRGTRTDAQGNKAEFRFYYDVGEYVDFDYSTSNDSGTGFVVWLSNCTLVGKFTSSGLRDSFGAPVSGFIVMRRCRDSTPQPAA